MTMTTEGRTPEGQGRLRQPSHSEVATCRGRNRSHPPKGYRKVTIQPRRKPVESVRTERFNLAMTPSQMERLKLLHACQAPDEALPLSRFGADLLNATVTRALHQILETNAHHLS